MHDPNRPALRCNALAPSAALLAALALGLISALPASARAAQHKPNPEVLVTTNMGSFVIELRPRRAPRTVANFLRYVQTGFYTDTLIHRVVANFIIQGGGHESTPPYARKPTGPPVVNESGNGLENQRGTVGLARGPNPDSGTSQFYINLVDNPELDPLPTRWGYTVFGKVVQGMSVVDRIGVVPTGAFGPFKSEAPLKPVIIESVTLVQPSQSGAGSANGTTSSGTTTGTATGTSGTATGTPSKTTGTATGTSGTAAGTPSKTTGTATGASGAATGTPSKTTGTATGTSGAATGTPSKTTGTATGTSGTATGTPSKTTGTKSPNGSGAAQAQTGQPSASPAGAPPPKP